MPVELTQNFEQVKNRLDATVAVQTTLLPSWLWEGFTIAAWEEMQRQFDPTSATPAPSLARAVMTAGVAYSNARQAYLNRLALIEECTGVALSGLRGRAREDEDLADSIAGLTSYSESQYRTVENAKALLVAWEDYNINWSPGSPYNYGDLNGHLTALPALDHTHRAARAALRKAETNLRRHAAAAEDKCMGWYAAATGRWPAGTTEGDLIRGQVPVSTSATTTPAPGKPASLTGLPIGNGRLVADSADATGASRYRWYTKGPGDATFVMRAETTTSEALLLNLTPGPHDLRVTGLNSGGEGVPSDVVSVIVT